VRRIVGGRRGALRGGELMEQALSLFMGEELEGDVD